MNRYIYVVIAERDTVDPFEAHGPIVFETNVAQSNPADALRQARNLGQKYGLIKIGRVEIIGTPDEIEQMLKDRIL